MKPRSFLAFLLLPPLGFVLPLAVAFISRTTRLSHIPVGRLAADALIGYGLGAVAYSFALRGRVACVAEVLATGQNPSDAVSDCLQHVEIVSALFWMIWGGVLALIGSAVLEPTFTGMQIFIEASLIVSVPAMAWAYWGGKWFLLRGIDRSRPIAYRGRVYSVGIKLGLVFIGFYVISLGALVQMIAAHLEYRLRDPKLQIDALVGDVTTFGISTAVVTTLIFAVATYLLARDIVGPIAHLRKLAGEMAEGRFDTPNRIFSDDEIGSVAERFSVTQTNLRSLIGRIGSNGSAITEGVRVMNGGTENLLAGAHEQRKLVASSSEALSGVRGEASSVLGAVERFAEVATDSASRAAELRASSAEVAHQMDELFQSVEKTSSSTMELDASASETSKRTAALAGYASELLTFVAEMEATVDEVHTMSSSTATIAGEVRQNASAARQAVRETVGGIRDAQESTRRTAGAFDELRKSLGKIDQILLLIGELTNRTNLLSFNAAIIAAQAGSQDYGFSVIADEIRQLADRTRRATKEIATIIRDVQPIAGEAVQALNEGVAHVDASVEMANRTEQALEQILGSADRSQEMSRRISRAIEEQSMAARHLHEIMTQTSDTVQEISRATTGQADAAALLATETERVRDIALHVKHASDEQTAASGGIAVSLEQIAADILAIRDRLQRQLQQTDDAATASHVTLTIAEKNSAIAEQFSKAIAALIHTGNQFTGEVERFRV